MIPYIRSCLKYFFFAGLFSLFINTLYLTFPLYMLAVYSRVLDSYSIPTLSVVTAMAFSALAVLSALDLLRSRLLVRAGIKLDALLTRKVLKRMLRDLCLADSIQYRRGLQDINVLRTYLGGNSIFAFFDVPWIFIYLGVIYLIHPILGMTATVGAVITLMIGLAQSSLSGKQIEKAGEYNVLGKEWFFKSIRAAGDLQSMGMVNNTARTFCLLNDREMALSDRVDQKNNLFTAMGQSFGILMQVVIFGAGAFLVLKNEANPGVIIAASIIMGRALAPVNQGIGAWKQASGAKTAYTNLKSLFEKYEQEKNYIVTSLEPELKVENATLDIGERRILDTIDFELKSGEIMGLMGPNGVGKTSLCRMILGMWAPTHGRVTLDDQDVYDLDNETLGKFLGYLPQNVELFSGTVSENIARMGEVDSEQVVAAAKRAGAHETILQFPNGYDTDIGEAGHSLSGGQRQRVGLARALFGNPKLVILDEPNSNLDDAGEKALLQALKNLKRMGTTTIMITHKPELLSTVDKILVLQKGHVAQFGDRDRVFEQLMGGYECKR